MDARRRNVYLFQFSFKFGEEVYLPYSAGMLWALARSIPDVSEGYKNGGFGFLREDPDAIVERLDQPAVAGFSTYVWNWEISVEVARRIKARHPSCFVVFGGPQVPGRIDGFFARYPFIDAVVHGEGELTFVELLRELRNDHPDVGRVAGLSFRGGTTAPRARLRDLDGLPSPYLTGVFDDLFALPYRYNAVWETNRGCPYACTFCDWGSAIGQKMSLFDEERLRREIEFFGERRITHIYAGDANFGIVDRDVRLAEMLADVKAKTGFPEKFRVNYAKNSTRRVYDIAKTLNRVKLDKGITLSVQSMDDTTLRTIKRKNLRYDSLSGFIKDYQRAGITTYSEVIVGLPGETYASFRDGINTLLKAGAHDSLYIYRCTVLPNAEMNDPDYRERHGIRTIRIPMYLAHAKPGEDVVEEYEEAIVETATLPLEEYRKCVLLAWAVQAFHALNLTQVLAVYAQVFRGVGYHVFYEELLGFAERHPETLIGRERARVEHELAEFLAQRTRHLVLDEMPHLSWAAEEFAYLHLSFERDRFYRELDAFLDELAERRVLDIDPILRADLLAYQRAIVVKWDRDGSDELVLSHSIHRFYRAALAGEPVELRSGSFTVRIRDDHRFDGDRTRYATEIVFWGRRGGKPIYSAIEERELPTIGSPTPDTRAAG